MALGLPTLAWAQTRVITGKVSVSGSTVPVAGARVSIEGSNVEAVTNNDGDYRLVAPEGTLQLIARALGYKRNTQGVAAGQSSANFALERDVLQIEGVVVTGQAT